MIDNQYKIIYDDNHQENSNKCAVRTFGQFLSDFLNIQLKMAGTLEQFRRCGQCDPMLLHTAITS